MTTTTDSAATASIEAAARELRLPAIRQHAGRLAAQAQRSKTTYLGFLADTLTVELDDRAERRRTRRIHEARFPRLKRLADFNLDAAPTINPATIATLAAGSYLDAGEPVVLIGDSGTGKTHLLIGLGITACEQGAGSVTPPAPSSSTNSSKPPTNAASLASSPAMPVSTCSASTSSATSGSTPVAPSCCSRFSPSARKRPRSEWPQI
jgi:hypothetical protein